MVTRNSKGQFKSITSETLTNAVSLRDLIAIEALKIYLTKDPQSKAYCAEQAYKAADQMLLVREQ